MGAANERRKAQPSIMRSGERHGWSWQHEGVLLFHPVLFSNDVKAVFVDTFWSPEHTRSATIAPTVAPTREYTQHIQQRASGLRTNIPVRSP